MIYILYYQILLLILQYQNNTKYNTKKYTKMEAAIKETVKNIFKTNKYEDAINITRNLRGEYIHEFGVKSWNGLVTYYRNANIQPAEIVAEEGAAYPETECEASEENCLNEISDNDVAEVESESENEVEETAEENEEPEPEAERIEYMLYRNTGAKVEWFGHRENFYGLEVGETARMIRMNNKGVSEGTVVASNPLTLDEIALFHKCYAVIIRMKRSYKEQLELAAKCLMNLPEAINGEYDRVPASDVKLADYVLNFKK